MASQDVQRRKKCYRLKSGQLRWCRGAEELMGSAFCNQGGKGIAPISITNVRTMTTVFSGLMYRHEAGRSATTYTLSHCPVCGVEISRAAYDKEFSE